ncbi:unnamed protein product [Polarella glacialis]|uniref:Gamma-glutamylcyclotransferase n=1 Tax=Polarella glacialis TaxID=89957 RepID=A0A813G5U5_POLGL|nr:unnamed protein product [Polarella glacialis]
MAMKRPAAAVLKRPAAASVLQRPAAAMLKRPAAAASVGRRSASALAAEEEPTHAPVAKEEPTHITILGFGSLLSERSARVSFPQLSNFRLARVPGVRRVFRHPAGIFFQRSIVPPGTKEFCSLSTERCAGRSIVVSAMEIPRSELTVDFYRREEEYDLVLTAFEPLGDGDVGGEGLLCYPAPDEAFVQKWGEARWQESYGRFGITTIWGHGPDSGVLPCPVYLRHCVLAVTKAGPEAHRSFLDDTFLVDRRTSIREYLERRPEIMELQPPPELAERYNG